MDQLIVVPQQHKTEDGGRGNIEMLSHVRIAITNSCRGTVRPRLGLGNACNQAPLSAKLYSDELCILNSHFPLRS